MVKKIIFGVFALLGLILTFGSEGAYHTTFSLEGGEQQRITLSHMSWDDSLASTAVIANVLEDEGFQVDLVQLDPAFIFSSLVTGDSDFSVSPWLPVTHASYIEEYGDQLDVIGPHMEGAKVALVVPAYMEEVESIEDLTDQANKTVTGIEPGAGITQQVNKVMDTYSNLSDWEHQQSSTGAMLTELRLAYNNQEEIVIAGWTPHWKFLEFDLKVLEDPQSVFGVEESITTVARQGLEEDNPVAYQIIENFKWDVEDVQEVMLHLQEGLSPDEAARVWMDENPEKVAEWTEGVTAE
jgi:glycine betaine/proline transport system substrate-binding protein